MTRRTKIWLIILVVLAVLGGMAENKYTGKKIFLLVEGNTPAREMHVLRNFNRFRNPWFVLDEDAESMRLNVFHFKADDLRHF